MGDVAPHWGSWERFSALAGIAAVVLWVVGIILFEAVAGAFPEEATPEESLAYFEENQNAVLTGAWIFMVGSLLFLWFVGVLRSYLVRFEGASGTFSLIAFAGGIATSVFLIVFPAGEAAAAISVDNIDGSVARALHELVTVFFIGAELAAIVLLVATAVVSLRTRAFPVWWAAFSVLVAIILVIGPIGWAALLIGLPIWTIGTSIMLFLRLPRGESRTAGITRE